MAWKTQNLNVKKGLFKRGNFSSSFAAADTPNKLFFDLPVFDYKKPWEKKRLTSTLWSLVMSTLESQLLLGI
ncbi:hypothetical protein SUGI_0504090 [Cryptomeria japonica]|nr:hypothetical protein SUGI_0504090 [Cryptomeria japonica]